MTYRVLTKLIGGGVEDCWTTDGKPDRYNSVAEAETAIREHVRDCKESGIKCRKSDFQIEAMITTVKELKAAIKAAKVSDVRECLFRIAREAYKDTERQTLDDASLDANKELGSDFIGEVTNHLEAYGFSPTEEV